jgi:hypothetical protein
MHRTPAMDAFVVRTRVDAGDEIAYGDPSVTEAHLAAWAEDDILHVLWQGQADRVQLGGGVADTTRSGGNISSRSPWPGC